MTETLTRPAQQPEPLRTRRQRRTAPAPLPGGTGLVLWTVSGLALLALWGVLYPVLIGALQQQDSQQRLFDELRQQLSAATAPVGPTAFGRPVALLDGPSAGLRSVVVVEGTTAQDLQAGPGHLRSSVLPGQAGTSVLLGKSVTYGAPFTSLAGLRAGDTITATTGQGVFTYRVEGLRRPGDPLPLALAPGKGRLILATSEGSGWRNGFAPSSVLYVDATLQGEAQPSPGGRPAVVPEAERPLGTTTEPLLLLVFWLQGLVLVVVGTVWLGARWGRWQAWAAGVPVVLALAIGASGTATQLLPNLL